MFTNKIAGASVAFAIGLASAEFAKSLTLKAVIPFLQRTLEYSGMYAIFGKSSAYDFQDIGTMGLYWICMIGVSYFISEYIFGRFLLGTATILSRDEKKTMKKAQKAVLDEPSPLEVVKNTVTSITGPTEGFEQSSTDFDTSLLPRV
jgi:hypothetical protein